jgi:hypothetical protein
MDNLLAWILMAAISLPVSYFVALSCLRGLVRMMCQGKVESSASQQSREFRF